MSKFHCGNVCLAVAAGILIVLVAAPVAVAQTDMGLDIRGGLTVPVGDLNDSHNLGFGTQGSIYFAFSPVAAAGLGVGYAWFQMDDSMYPNYIKLDGGNFSTLSICPELRFMVGAANMPTFTAIIGAGLYRLMQADLDVTNLLNPDQSGTIDFKSQNKFGANIAGRVVFPVAPMVKLGFEAMNHIIFTDNNSLSFFEFMAVMNITPGS